MARKLVFEQGTPVLVVWDDASEHGGFYDINGTLPGLIRLTYIGFFKERKAQETYFFNEFDKESQHIRGIATIPNSCIVSITPIELPKQTVRRKK